MKKNSSVGQLPSNPLPCLLPPPRCTLSRPPLLPSSTTAPTRSADFLRPRSGSETPLRSSSAASAGPPSAAAPAVPSPTTTLLVTTPPMSPALPTPLETSARASFCPTASGLGLGFSFAPSSLPRASLILLSSISRLPLQSPSEFPFLMLISVR